MVTFGMDALGKPPSRFYRMVLWRFSLLFRLRNSPLGTVWLRMSVRCGLCPLMSSAHPSANSLRLLILKIAIFELPACISLAFQPLVAAMLGVHGFAHTAFLATPDMNEPRKTVGESATAVGRKDIAMNPNKDVPRTGAHRPDMDRTLLATCQIEED